MVTQPRDLHEALSEAYNAGDLEALLSLYEPRAAFVVEPGHVTRSEADLRTALQHLLALRGRLTIDPQTFIGSDDLVLVLGTFTLSGHRRSGTQFERTSRFVDVLRRRPNGRWLLAVDNPYGGEQIVR